VALLYIKILQYSAFPGSDFEQDYIAASRLLNGLSIYDGTNAHPPFNALLFSPLLLFSIQGAFIAAGTLSLAVLWLNTVMITKGLALKQTDWYVIFAISLFWPVTMAAVCLGQSSALWAGAVTAGWLCEKRNRPIAAGVFVGLSILIKLIPALLVIMWYLNKRWRAALSATAVVLAGFLLMIGLVGFNEILYFFFTRAPENARNYLDFYGNASISGAAEKLFGSNGGWSRTLVDAPILARVITLLGCGAIALATIVVSSLPSAKEVKELDDYRTALVIVGMLLVSPLTWPHYFLVLLFPLLLLLCTGEDDNSITIKGKGAVLFSIILLGVPTFVEEISGQSFHFWAQQPAAIQLITLSQTIGLCMLWSLLAERILFMRNLKAVSAAASEKREQLT
jgi:uncharacterized membrane protein